MFAKCLLATVGIHRPNHARTFRSVLHRSGRGYEAMCHCRTTSKGEFRNRRWGWGLRGPGQRGG